MSGEEEYMARKPNVSVKVSRDEPIERALRRFKGMCQKAGISKIVRMKRYYEKPSEERRRSMRKQIRNRRRAERKLKERMERKIQKARARQRSYLSASAPLITPGTNIAVEQQSAAAVAAPAAPAPAPTA
jgi:small subunit ribosomal protein S21